VIPVGPRVDRRDSWLRILEIVLLCIATLAAGWYAFAQVTARRDQVALARELKDRTSVRDDARAVPERGALIGRVEVPRLAVSALAREGADEQTFSRAVGHVPDTALPGEAGNAAFAGHRDTFFRRLKHVRAGDEIVVTTPNGRYQYVVRETRVVKPSDVWVLDPTAEPTLTLVTCYPFDALVPGGPLRYVVVAEADGRGRPTL